MPGSSFLHQITPLILTFDESPNIGRVLAKLDWAREVVVVDSGSTDGTLDIVRTFRNTRVLHRPFDNHASQWNFGLQQAAISTEWVLALDADYVLSDSLVQELAILEPADEMSGYRTRFRYVSFGRTLKGTLYPPVTTLYRRSRGRYRQDGHTQRLTLQGMVGALQARILHDDRKSLTRWLWAQNRYCDLEVAHLTGTPWAELDLADKLRRLLVIMPWLVPLYCLFAKGVVLDGWPGVYYAIQRGITESILALKLIESMLKSP